MRNRLLLFLFVLPQIIFSQGVNITSWKVNTTGHQAQYYNSSNVVQNLNDSSEVLELCYNTDTVYIRTSFLASYIMGDWPGDPFLADGQNKTYNIPRNPTYPSATHKAKPTSITGLLVNGVPIYDDGDGKSYNSSTNKNENSGAGVWNQLAWIAHAAEMDAGNCHPDPNNNYHNHFNPIELYDESASTTHSPIVGWAFDGFPVYGPFGYTTATNSSSAIKRMTSSWSLRNITTRTTLYTGATASQTGPAVSTSFPLGMYKEDYQYVANSGDLDYYNGRYCVTPEFPSGTYAYFVNTDATGSASYPNMIGPSYYGGKTFAGSSGPVSGNASKPTSSLTCISGTLPTVTLSTGATSISEASGTTTVTATLSRTYSSTVSVSLSLSGTATSGSDYSLSTSISVPAGSTSASINLSATQDVVYEGSETVIIDISSVTNGTESSTQQKTVTITDDESAPTVTLSTGTTSISEANASTTVTATLSNASTSAVSVTLALTGTATVATDYTLSTSITVPAGSTSASINLTSVQDAVYEGNETVIIDVSAVTNGTESGVQQKTVTITDDESAPTVTLSTGTTSISEANASTTVTATLSNASTSAVSVTLALTGTATVATDYTLSTTITVPAGSTSASINLTSVQDAVYEGNETVIIDVTAVTNGTESGVQQKTVTITDDESAPTVTLSVGSSTLSEGSASTTVTASASATSASVITVTLTLSGTATLSADYSLATTITIPAGSTSASVNVTSIQDALYEGNETVIIDISAVTNATESGAQQQTVTISDDDSAPTVTVAWSNTSIGESAAGTSNAVVTLSAASGMTTTATVTFSNTATLNTDYTVTGTTITIPAGSTTGFVTMNNIADNLYEGNEYITVDIATVTNATEVGNQSSTMTINDDDAAPTVALSVGSTSISEASGSTTIVATLSAVSGLPTTVTIATSGTAISGTDYSIASTSLVIAAGSISASTTITTTQDVLVEGNETVIIDITAVTNGTESGTQQQTIAIADDDQPLLEVYESVQLYNDGDTLKFGDVNLSGGDKTISLSLKNSGTGALQIDSIRLRNNTNAYFTLNTTGADLDLAENEYTDISVTFTNACSNTSNDETMIIYSNGSISEHSLVLKANSKDDVLPVADVSSLPALSFECPDFTLTAPTATDNCSGTIAGTTPALNLATTYQGTMTITWSYSDAAGNVTTQDQQITVEDVTAPTITCPSNVGVDSDVDVAVTYTVPVPTENCTGYTLVINNNAYSSGSMFSPNTSSTVQYTVTDIGGNTASCSFDIIVSPITSVYSSAELSQNANIYPNPTEGMVRISLTKISLDVQIFDSKGILLKTIEDVSSDMEVDLTAYGAGIYQAVFSTESGERFTKVITVMK